MTSADFSYLFPSSPADGSTWHGMRSPRVRRTVLHAYPHRIYNIPSVQVLGFEDMCLLSRSVCLLCGFCSSRQRFACGFLQTSPHGGSPYHSASSSPCRACRGLSPPSRCNMPGAHKTGALTPMRQSSWGFSMVPEGEFEQFLGPGFFISQKVRHENHRRPEVALLRSLCKSTANQVRCESPDILSIPL